LKDFYLMGIFNIPFVSHYSASSSASSSSFSSSTLPTPFSTTSSEFPQQRIRSLSCVSPLERSSSPTNQPTRHYSSANYSLSSLQHYHPYSSPDNNSCHSVRNTSAVSSLIHSNLSSNIVRRRSEPAFNSSLSTSSSSSFSSSMDFSFPSEKQTNQITSTQLLDQFSFLHFIIVNYLSRQQADQTQESLPCGNDSSSTCDYIFELRFDFNIKTMKIIDWKIDLLAEKSMYNL
jgi:hypothetical protein